MVLLLFDFTFDGFNKYRYCLCLVYMYGTR